jgi:hypothetical protein
MAPENRPKTGDRIVLDGFTRSDGFLPHIESHHWTILGRAELPEPYRISADEIYLPRFDTAWVEVPAVVVGVETGGWRGASPSARTPPSPSRALMTIFISIGKRDSTPQIALTIASDDG